MIFARLQYRDNADEHCVTSLQEGVIGIPDKKFTKGKHTLRSVSSENHMYGLLYNTRKKEVVGIFSTLGEAYVNDENLFSGKNDWPLQVKAMTFLAKNGVPRSELPFKISQGSLIRITEEQWIEIKDKIISLNNFGEFDEVFNTFGGAGTTPKNTPKRGRKSKRATS